MNRPQKEDTVRQLHARLRSATSVLLTEYRGLTVAQMNQLRRKLRTVAGEYRVAKNRLVRLAVEGTPFVPLREHFTGQTGLVLGYGNPVNLAKVLTRYAKESEKLSIRGGVVDGQVLEAVDVEALACIPSQEELRGRLLGLLCRPATHFLRLLKAPAASLVLLLGQMTHGMDQGE